MAFTPASKAAHFPWAFMTQIHRAAMDCGILLSAKLIVTNPAKLDFFSLPN